MASHISGPDQRTFTILASCMHAGVRILKVHLKEGEWTIEIVARFEEHESMNYASDWQLDFDVNGKFCATVISTSFYDKKLCIWRFKDSQCI